MSRKRSTRPTSFDIAYLAGVSQPTVSRALRGSRSVSLETRQRIEAIARDLNYSVDKNASSLRSQRSNTLALLFFEDPTPDGTNINPFFLAMLGAITRATANRGLDLLISFQKMEDDWHVRYQDSHRADGLILLGYGDYTLYTKRLSELEASGTHFVRWGAVCEDNIGTTVGSDNFGAGRQAGEHLISLGRQRIAFLGQADQHYPEFAERYRGLCAAMIDAGCPVDPALLINALSSEDDGRRAVEQLLRSNRPFDAIFAASDLIAIGAIQALTAAGLRVPDDIAVTGFDNIPAASMTFPPLTTLNQDLKVGGELLVEALLAQIENEPAPHQTIPARLIVRKSTAG